MLDEIDQLLSKDQDILYRIFEWPSLQGFKCSVIGIANALDLTQRFLPRLVAKDCKYFHYCVPILTLIISGAPTHVVFSPYTAQQIADIIKDRLSELSQYYGNAGDGWMLMQNAAIELCARKAAAMGDLRRAFDICRQSIEVMEADFKNTSQVGSPLSSKTRENIPPALPKVTIQHVLKVINVAFGSANPSVAKIRSLTPQQKLVVVLIHLVQNSDENLGWAATTIAGLYDIYLEVCTKGHLLDPVQRTQFLDIISAVESTGILSLAKSTAANRNSNSNSTTPNRNKKSATPTKLTPVKKLCTMMDNSSRVVLNVNADEVRMGIENVLFLVDFMAEGLSDYVASKDN